MLNALGVALMKTSEEYDKQDIALEEHEHVLNEHQYVLNRHILDERDDACEEQYAAYAQQREAIQEHVAMLDCAWETLEAPKNKSD